MIPRKDVPRAEAAAPVLLPSQASALEEVEALLRWSPVAALVGLAGTGKSLLAREIAARHGGLILGWEDYLAEARITPFDRWDERVLALLRRALAKTDFLILDDYIQLIASGREAVVPHFSSRYMSDCIELLHDEARAAGKKLLFVGLSHGLGRANQEHGNDYRNLYSMRFPCPRVQLFPDGLTFEDYRAVAANVLGPERAGRIDMRFVRHQASALSLRQLRLGCELVSGLDSPDATALVEALARDVVRDNVPIEEVEAIAFDQLPGTEDIVRELETHVVLPFENPQLALDLGVKARRGVMLFGPPGTGKTSIGRALARRMKGRFFLIDGSFPTEPPNAFFTHARAVIEQARESAPSVLFIDDADTLLSVEHVAGLTRYLLTLLDGVESESSGRVCVMMTVMDAARIPEALLRSGRIELWLETTTPDRATRARILARWSQEHAGEGIDHDRLAGLIEGCTPADLRRVCDDARLLAASDVAADRDVEPFETYLERAIGELIAMRANMADSLGDNRLRLMGKQGAAQ